MKNLFVIVLLFSILSCNKSNSSNSEQNSESMSDTTKTKIGANAIPGVADAENYVCIPYQKVGKILPTHTYKDLQKIFGVENVNEDTLFIDGEIGGYTTTVKVTPRTEVQIYWKEGKAPYNTIEMVRIRGLQSYFKTPQGLKLGTTVTEIVAMNNNKDFQFAGFGWDGSGSCCKGLAPEIFDGIRLTLSLPTDNYGDFSAKEQEQILTDKLISSNLPIWQKKMPTVVEMYIQLNK